jgi:hypothetical protein
MLTASSATASLFGDKQIQNPNYSSVFFFILFGVALVIVSRTQQTKIFSKLEISNLYMSELSTDKLSEFC